MMTVIPTLAVAFAAFCVWLIVRIINRRERWAKWTAAAILVAAFYLFSLGPTVWLYDEDLLPDWVALIYAPVGWAYNNGPDEIRESIDAWMNLWRVK
jgi:hypothetical protein